jgi:hypothetical protein
MQRSMRSGGYVIVIAESQKPASERHWLMTTSIERSFAHYSRRHGELFGPKVCIFGHLRSERLDATDRRFTMQ